MELFNKFISRPDLIGFGVCLIIVIIIGVVVHFIGKNFQYKREKAKELEKDKNVENVKTFLDLSDEEKATVLEFHNIKMVNIYRSLKVMVAWHNQMVAGIVKFLVVRGYTLRMAQEDIEAYEQCNCPVLVIVPSLKVYMYHTDQRENRKNSVAFELSNNNSYTEVCKSLESVLDQMEV